MQKTVPPHGPALRRAIDICGGRAALARAISAHAGTVKPLSRQAIYYWGETVPAKWCRAVEAVSGVPRYELRPDIYGPAPPARDTPMVAA
jgi:DNA-binding transcriptional regulator YdaS (Cro superfamily)